jgi:hypothetical protein
VRGARNNPGQHYGNSWLHETSSGRSFLNAKAWREGLPRLANVRFWHKADMLNALTTVRFWGQSGHLGPGGGKASELGLQWRQSRNVTKPSPMKPVASLFFGNGNFLS